MSHLDWLKLYFDTTNCTFDLTKRKSKKKKAFKVGIKKELL